MKIGIDPLNVGVSDPASMLALAQKVEEVGFESVFTFEHVIIPERYDSPYPYSPKGKMPVAETTPFVDPLVSLAYVAGGTKTVKLGTGVNILPQANPLLFAKQVASLDFVSGGRLLLGVGVGWLAEEYAALGVPFERRGARFDDYIRAMKKVWSGEVVEHQSDFIQWSGFRSHPQPAQRPHPPILIGGASDRALRRVVELGDGYIAPNKDIDELETLTAKLNAAAKAEGRDPSSIEITAKWIFIKEPDALTRLVDLGVTRAVVPLRTLPDADPMVGLEKLAERLAKQRA
jgi:probable F420-dependent oxidoreductase